MFDFMACARRHVCSALFSLNTPAAYYKDEFSAARHTKQAVSERERPQYVDKDSFFFRERRKELYRPVLYKLSH
jgi:hypothetical protein